MTGLKPCPFCGSRDIYPDAFGSNFGNCRECGASGPSVADNSWEAAWNNRVSPWRSLKDDPPNKAPVLIRRGQRASWRFGAQIMPWLPVSEYYFERGYTEWMEVPE